MINFRKLSIGLGAVAALFVVAGYAAPASSQATRTWVSGVGDDANPCSRTAPCKTFAGAISKTAPAGEINCLDPGGFGGRHHHQGDLDHVRLYRGRSPVGRRGRQRHSRQCAGDDMFI